MNVRQMHTRDEVARCHRVMVQLRPHLDLEAFLDQVAAQQTEDGYRLAVVEEDGQVRAVAGFRVGRMLYRGRFLYVDDLVTDGAHRSRAHGRALFDWLVAEARRLGCDQLCLESGVQRFDAHRFYFRQRMHVSAYHFTLPLAEAGDPPTREASSTT